MNILFCYRNWMNPYQGGVQKVTDTLARYFVEQGNNLFYLTLQYNESDKYQFPAQIFHLPNPELFSKSNSVYYHKLIEQFSIDIIINNDASNDRTRFFLNTGKLKVKKISWFHTDPSYGLGILRKSLNRYKSWITCSLPKLVLYYKIVKKRREINYLLKYSDKLVFLSNAYIREISEKLGINSFKIAAISNPCNYPKLLAPSEKKKIVLFVARIDIITKRPDKMLQIWAQISDRHPDWELVFLGDGPDRKAVEDLCKSFQLQNVRFEGFVAPESYYQDASIICMTSDYEGFGLVLIEAMQYGVVPVAFNNWGSLKDIITDLETGILVPTNDISTYTSRIDQLMFDELMRKRISANATKHAKNFQIESIGPKWDRILEDIIKS